MAEYTVLPWQNENSLSSYPLVLPFDYDGFIVDASFIQFDYFIPLLKNVFVSPSEIAITIIFDYVELTQQYQRSEFNDGKREVRFIDNDRYLGCLTLGENTVFLWDNFVGQNISRQIPFLANTVRSIPSKDAVYTFDGIYGDVIFDVELDEIDTFTSLGEFNYGVSLINGLIFQSSAGGNNIFYNINTGKNALVFNAVGNYTLPEQTVWALKKINLIPPINNNLFLSSNDVIKFNSINNQKIQVSLAGENDPGASIVPTLTS